MRSNNIVANVKKNAVVILLALLVLIATAAIAYLVVQNNQLRNDPQTLQTAQAKKDEELLAKIAKIYTLPTDEKPVLGRVDDKEKLKDQPFFKDAQNGDRLVIFAKSKKAIIYRESENKIINAGPIAITTDSVKSEPAPTTQQNSSSR